jgi:hypothetical protein
MEFNHVKGMPWRQWFICPFCNKALRIHCNTIKRKLATPEETCCGSRKCRKAAQIRRDYTLSLKLEDIVRPTLEGVAVSPDLHVIR